MNTTNRMRQHILIIAMFRDSVFVFMWWYTSYFKIELMFMMIMRIAMMMMMMSDDER